MYSGFILPLLQVQFKEYLSCVEDSSGGHRRILVSISLDIYLFPLFIIRKLNFGIVINKFSRLYVLYEMD